MANLSNINNKFLVTTGGDVGIGITSPVEKLDTLNIAIGGATITSYSPNKLRIDNNGGNSRFYSTGANTTTAGSYQIHVTSSDGSINNPALTIASDTNATFTGDVTIGGKTYPKISLTDNQGVARTFSVGTSNETFTVRNETASSDAFTISNANNATFVGDVFAPRFDVGTTSTSIIQESNRMKFTNAIANNAGGFDFFTRNSSSTYINALTILGSGNVGIGTDSPGSYDGEADNLVVYDAVTPGITIALPQTTAAGSARGSILFSDGTSGNQKYRGGVIYDHGTGMGGVADTMYLRAAVNSYLALNALGNVGIGTKTPRAVGSGYKGLEVSSPSSGSSLWLSGFSDTTKGYLAMDTGGLNLTAISNHSLTFGTNNSPKMTILSGGNVGIGTTSPTEKLSVSGNIELDDMPANGTRYLMTNETNTGTGRINIQAGGGSAAYGGGLSLLANSHASKPGWVIAGISSGAGSGATEGRFVVNTHGLGTGTDIFTVLRTGNVGIGTDTPLNKLFVSASTAGDYAGFIENTNSTNGYGLVARTAHTGASAYAFAARAASTDILVVRADGNVGIGTDSPGVKLEIAETAANTDCVVRIKAARDAYLQFSPANTTKWALIADYPALGDFTTYNYPNNFSAIVCKDNKDITTNLSGGNFGINTTSPTAKLHITEQAESNYFIKLTGTLGTGNTYGFKTNGGDSQVLSLFDVTSNNRLAVFGNTEIRFATGGTGRFLIDSSGDIDIANATTGNAGTKIFGAANGGIIYMYRPINQGTQAMRFYVGTTSVGYIGTSNSGAAFVSNSDYRLKENVVELTGALDRISELKPSRFNFIVEPNKTVDGFLAHEVQDIVPEAVFGEKDAVDEEGNPDYQAMEQSKLVPLLVAAIQELKAEIELLKSK